MYLQVIPIPIPIIIASLTIESLRVMKLENNQHLKSSMQQPEEWEIARQCFLNYSWHYSDVNITKIFANKVISSDHYSKKTIRYEITLQHICPVRLKILKPSQNTVFLSKKNHQEKKKKRPKKAPHSSYSLQTMMPYVIKIHGSIAELNPLRNISNNPQKN